MRVLLVDDNRLMLEGLQNLLEAHAIEVAGKLLEEFKRAGNPESRHPSKVAARNGEAAPVGGLNARQIEVLRLVADGLTYKEVGARLFLSERTIKYHMSEIMNRLHLENRSQVLAFAGRMGLAACRPQK